MDKKALDILADAISDVGSWQWWHLEKDMLQLEFRDVQLYDASKAENDTHTTDSIAVRFFDNVFIVFLDDLTGNEEKPWYKRLYDDEIPAFECDGYELKFDSLTYAKEVLGSYKNRTPATPFDSENTLAGAKHLIAAKCGDVGFVAGGDLIKIVTRNASITEEEVEPLARKWWDYWKEYWRLRGTKDALPKDWACEVTIPVDLKEPQGYF